MLTTEQATELLRRHRSHLAAAYGVRRIGLFGSYARGEPGVSSDLDIVIEFERPIGLRFVELAEYLEQLLGRPVDILTPAGIEGIRIPHISREIRESIVYV